MALAERGVPALAIDITPYAVIAGPLTGALALQRDVFGHVPGAGRWATILLADGNIGIGGDPAALLRRAASLLMPGGAILVELGRRGCRRGPRPVRLRTAGEIGHLVSLGLGRHRPDQHAHRAARPRGVRDLDRCGPLVRGADQRRAGGRSYGLVTVGPAAACRAADPGNVAG